MFEQNSLLCIRLLILRKYVFHNIVSSNILWSENLEQLSFWQTKSIYVFPFQLNSLEPTQNGLDTNTKDVTNSLSVKKLHHQTYHLFLEQKRPQNIVCQNNRFTSLFSYQSHCSFESPLYYRN